MKSAGTALVVRSAPHQAPAKAHQSLENAIQSFRGVLTPEQKIELDRVKSVPDADAVLTFTAQLDAQRRNVRGRSIASRLCSILQSVRDYSAIIDTFVSSNPTIAALVWGSVKVTMLLVINYTSHYEALSEMFMDLGAICPHFEQYQALFPSSIGVQSALSEFHASIIRCCQHMVMAIRRPWHAQVYFSFSSSFQQEFKPDVDEIKRNCTAVERELDFARAQAEHKSQQLQAVERVEAGESRRWLSQVLKPTAMHLDEWKQEHERQRTRQRKQALLDSLSSYDYLNPLKQNRRKRSSRTAKWIFETPEYGRWLHDVPRDNNLSLLWCHGKIGSGKTILLTSVIDDLLVNKTNPDNLVAFFFPRFDNTESLRAETILRSIAVQLLKSASLSEEAMMMLATVESAPSFDAYHFITLVKSVFKPATTVDPHCFYLIIDGIDECERQERNALLRTLSSLESITSKTQAIRIFVTSRHPRTKSISDRFSHIEDIYANSAPAMSDIAVFIDDEIKDLEESGELVVGDRSIIQQIKRLLFKHADGMFLWVTLALREICHQRCDEDIRKALESDNLPQGLPEMFARTLSRIVSQNNAKITQQILPWIVASKRPLTLDELAESVLVEVLQPNAQIERRINGIQNIGIWFNGLVEVDEEKKTVHFSHASVRHFLLGTPVKQDLAAFHINPDNADHHLGEVCVTYLNFGDFQTTLARRRRDAIRLVPKDIAQTALTHEWSSSVTSKLTSLLSERHSPSAKENIDRTITMLQSEAILADDTKVKHPFLNYAASKWILHTSGFNNDRSESWQIWEDMIANGHSVAQSPLSGDVLPALSQELVDWAFDERHFGLLSVVRCLGMRDFISRDKIVDLAKNGDVELLSSFRGTDLLSSTLLPAVRAAAKKGHLEVVELIISDVADKHIWNELCERALLCASGWGHQHIVQWLLSQGVTADPLPVYDRMRRTPLQIASQYGHVEVMKILLDAGARVHELKPGDKTSLAFKEAVSNNHIDAALLLIQHGADVDTLHLFADALIVASARGNEDMVQFLLNEGANPNGSLWDSSPLKAAARQGHIAIVKQLLRAGASLVGSEMEVLEAAAASGDIKLMEHLLKENPHWGSQMLSLGPIQAAAKFDHCHIIQLLRSYGASIQHSSPTTHQSALQTAVEFGRASTVEYLLRTGAVFASDENGRRLFQLAKSRGDLAVLNVLRENGASGWDDSEQLGITITVQVDVVQDLIRRATFDK